MNKHTPGPWTLHADGRSIEAGLTTVCTFPHPTLPCDPANAKLIAAAPELAEALQWATTFLDANYRDSDMPELAMLRAALAKAGL